MSEHLRSEGKDKPAELADKAAARVADLGDYLKRSDGDAILRDVERFGRDKPWAVMAGGVMLGIAASRFLKASSSRRYHEQESSPNLPARTADVDRDVLPTPTPAPVPAAMAPVAEARRAAMSTHDTDMRDRPIGELVKELAGQTSTLVRQEIQLAQAEISTKGKLAGRGAGMLAGAAIAGLLALIALTAVLIAALDTAVPLWLAALIVTVLWAVIGAGLAARGRKELQQAAPPVPEQTVETVKEDIQWAKTQTGSART